VSLKCSVVFFKLKFLSAQKFQVSFYFSLRLLAFFFSFSLVDLNNSKKVVNLWKNLALIDSILFATLRFYESVFNSFVYQKLIKLTKFKVWVAARNVVSVRE
jgi:hypothetical protein